MSQVWAHLLSLGAYRLGARHRGALDTKLCAISYKIIWRILLFWTGLSYKARSNNPPETNCVIVFDVQSCLRTAKKSHTEVDDQKQNCRVSLLEKKADTTGRVLPGTPLMGQNFNLKIAFWRPTFKFFQPKCLSMRVDIFFEIQTSFVL